MFVVAITGGIAMGKSSVTGRLRRSFAGAICFDADACVRRLLTDAEICRKIASEFGGSALTEDGQVDRPYLRSKVFDNASRRAALEGILHPEVRREFLSRLEAARVAAPVFLADIPLLYETGYEYPRDVVLVVASDSATQRRRLLGRKGIDAPTANAMVAAQLPIEDKIARADHVIWNAGSEQQLDKQTNYFSKWLKMKI